MPKKDFPCRARDKAVDRSIHSYNKRTDASPKDQRASDRQCGHERKDKIAAARMREQRSEA